MVGAQALAAAALQGLTRRLAAPGPPYPDPTRHVTMAATIPVVTATWADGRPVGRPGVSRAEAAASRAEAAAMGRLQPPQPLQLHRLQLLPPQLLRPLPP